ncbi:MAG: diaminopimelate epimerase [Tumebacillaceae bacterium]
MDFYRYHGLGNDYLVMDPAKTDIRLTPEAIRLICQPHFGEGSDGILYGPVRDEATGRNRVHIYNPDGSEAEKSGNGTRIFARYMVDAGYEQEGISFELQTLGGLVRACVYERQTRIRMVMGTATFDSDKLPVIGPSREIIREELVVADERIEITCVSMGNPHCVILTDNVTPEYAKLLGPHIEHHPMFPNRTNMQLLKVLDRRNIQIEIWERGASYTLASGSSSCAAAAVAYRLGLVDSEVTVHMAGGDLLVKINDDYVIEQEGPVAAVTSGVFAEEFKTVLRAYF